MSPMGPDAGHAVSLLVGLLSMSATRLFDALAWYGLFVGTTLPPLLTVGYPFVSFEVLLFVGILTLPAVQSRSRKSAQDDKWSFCLTVGTLCPSNQERP
jgi:uncharacterized protein (DUF486 family)